MHFTDNRHTNLKRLYVNVAEATFKCSLYVNKLHLHVICTKQAPFTCALQDLIFIYM
jgi:hypothetical protein